MEPEKRGGGGCLCFSFAFLTSVLIFHKASVWPAVYASERKRAGGWMLAKEALCHFFKLQQAVTYHPVCTNLSPAFEIHENLSISRMSDVSLSKRHHLSTLLQETLNEWSSLLNWKASQVCLELGITSIYNSANVLTVPPFSLNVYQIIRWTEIQSCLESGPSLWRVRVRMIHVRSLILYIGQALSVMWIWKWRNQKQRAQRSIIQYTIQMSSPLWGSDTECILFPSFCLLSR